MLKINFAKEEGTKIQEFALAVKYAECDINIQLLNDELKKLEKKLEKDDIEVAEKEYFESQTKDIEAAMTKLEETMAQTEDYYVLVLDAITQAGNKEKTVVRILRMVASARNSKLMKYAIHDIADEELYKALEAIHIYSNANEYGMCVSSKEVKDAYKRAKISLETIIKKDFSLSFENEYTKKVNVKLNGGDIKLINDCYVTGIRNKFDTSDNGDITYKNTVINTLVSKKTNKKTGKTTYNMTKLFKVIADIVLVKYCK